MRSGFVLVCMLSTATPSFCTPSPDLKYGTLKPADVQTEVFLLPAAAVAEGDGSFTNTQRLVQFHEKAVDPPGDARTDLWFTFHLGRRLQQMYQDLHEKRRKEPGYGETEQRRDWAIRNL